MIKNDKWIRIAALDGVITPYSSKLIRQLGTDHDAKIISYGQSSYGYDLRLSPLDFRIFRHIPGQIIDPKRFNANSLIHAELHETDNDRYFILPGHSYGLGTSIEKLTMPSNVTGLCIGKSTYARCGIIVNMTPVEAGWIGHLTIEISNSSPADARIYAGEGILQLIFLGGEDCNVNYATRDGKYQNQKQEVVLPRI